MLIVMLTLILAFVPQFEDDDEDEEDF